MNDFTALSSHLGFEAENSFWPRTPVHRCVKKPSPSESTIAKVRFRSNAVITLSAMNCQRRLVKPDAQRGATWPMRLFAQDRLSSGLKSCVILLEMELMTARPGASIQYWRTLFAKLFPPSEQKQTLTCMLSLAHS